MYYIISTPNQSGAYPPPQSNPANSMIPLTYEQAEAVIRYNGFVTIKETEHGITVEPNIEAWEEWKASLPKEDEEPHTYTPLELAQQTITDLDLELIQMGQEMTDMELLMYELVKNTGGGGTQVE